MTNQQQP